MTAPEDADRHRDPEAIVRLRGDPPRVVRLSRKAVLAGSAVALALVGGALLYGLAPASAPARHEALSTGGVALADGVASAPRDYAAVPKLGPPLPGDLGKPMLDARDRGAVAALPPLDRPPGPRAADTDPAALARRHEREIREAARTSRLFASRAAPDTDYQHPALASESGEGRSTPSVAGHLELAPPARAGRVLRAGSIIPAALITGIRSDRPGLVTAQVTANVYDSATGSNVLVPQGSRLLGDYRTDVGLGQRRVMLEWKRLVFPDGHSLGLEGQRAADPSGYSGLEDEVDNHWGNVIKAALVSTLLGIGGELGADRGDELAEAVRRAGQDSVGRGGERVVDRELGLRPTLTIRPGSPVRVLVASDLVFGDAP